MSRTRQRSLAGVAAFWLATQGLAPGARAEENVDLASRLGAMPTVRNISLAPDGSKVALVKLIPAGSVLFVADVVGKVAPRLILRLAADRGMLEYCLWSTSQRLVCQVRFTITVEGTLTTATRMFALDADGGKIVQLSSEMNQRSRGLIQFGGDVLALDMPDQPGVVVMSRSFVPDTQIGSRLGSNREGLGVEAVDTVTLKRRQLVAPRPNAVEYIADERGNVRIMGMQDVDGNGYLKSTLRYLFRRPGSDDWQQLSAIGLASGAGAGGFNPYAIDGPANVAYGFDDLEGRAALYRVSLDGSGRRELVLAQPGFDVDQLIQVGRTQRVVGVSYATDRRVVEYFDPVLRRLAAGLAKALPDQPTIEIIDATEGETSLLVIASGDTAPGMSYIYDKASHHLDEVLPIRAELEGLTLARMKPVTYTARDGTAIPGYLTLPPGSSGKGLPAIVMPHGGPAQRDEWGFDWLVQFFALRGYAVLQPNYRGSTGYGAAWFEKNGFQSWPIAMNDILDAGRWLEHEGIAAPGKLAIVGWSYGGYAALQTAVVDPKEFKAIVAIAPVADLDRFKAESETFTNHVLVEKTIGAGPHIAAGSPARHAERITAPVLLFAGDKDQNVGVGESRLMNERLKSAGKQVRYIEFAGLDHQLESAEARTTLLSTSDAFLRTALGLGL